jgi:hypothetical protein
MSGSSQIDRVPGGAPGKLVQCEKCLAPLASVKTMICPRCGWYAIAGTFIDIDRSWEAEDEAETKARRAESQIPRWAWIAIASAVAIIIESAIVRIVTPDGSRLRTAWSGAQFVLGVAGFLVCQLVGFVVLMRQDSTVSVLDAVLKPFKISGALFRELPRRFWVVNAGISGLVAVLAAVAIIGSVPYHALWSWSIDYRSSQHLEDALAQELAPDAAKIADDKDKNRKTTSCVIIGYELNDTGNLRVVLLAREVHGKLRYSGGVEPTGDPAQLFELREKLLENKRRGPVIPMDFDSNWVNPTLTCLISYAIEQENKKLTEVRWEGDVREMRLPGK